MTYQSVINAASQLEKQGLCRLNMLDGGIICMSTTDRPGPLVTAGIHGNEHYSTIDTIFRLVRSGFNGHLIPLIDVEEYESTHSIREGWQIYHSLRSHRRTKVPDLDSIADRVNEVIDLHNWVMGGYMFIHTKALPQKTLKRVSTAAAPHVYNGCAPGYFYKGFNDGFYIYTGKDSGMIGWAESRGLHALAIEVPVLSNCRDLLDLDYIASKNCEIIRAFCDHRLLDMNIMCKPVGKLY